MVAYPSLRRKKNSCLCALPPLFSSSSSGSARVLRRYRRRRRLHDVALVKQARQRALDLVQVHAAEGRKRPDRGSLDAAADVARNVEEARIVGSLHAV